ncbi:hypothetical protein BDE36_1160 [Arcticibacter tournemirensis]|nr:hypothetical protein BDE36_1160 [Arcticibacter tournemirensis]
MKDCQTAIIANYNPADLQYKQEYIPKTTLQLKPQDDYNFTIIYYYWNIT